MMVKVVMVFFCGILVQCVVVVVVFRMSFTFDKVCSVSHMIQVTTVIVIIVLEYIVSFG